MPRARRTLTDAEILGMVLNTSAARRLQGSWPAASDRRRASIAPTAVFLLLALGLTILAFAATFLWGTEPEQGAEEHCGHVAGAGAHVEQVQRDEPVAPPRREGNHVAHGPQIACGNGGGA